MADKTFDPELTDVNLTNTTDFLKKFSDYNKLIGKFAKEIAISNVFNHTDVVVDPVTAKAELFRDLTKGKLKLKDDPRGSKDKKGKTFPTPVKDATVGLNKDSANGLDDNFLAYWIEKYRKLHPKIQEECEKLLPGTANEYFKDISESIGCLTEVDFIDDTAVLPTWDADVKKYDPPVAHNSKLHNKLSKNTKMISLKMSTLLNAHSRNNLGNIINGPNSHKLDKDSSEDAHGNNLITDFSHRTRMNKIVTELVSTLQKQYKDLWRLVDWFNTRTNKSTYKFQKVKLEVEGVQKEIDLLKNKLQKTKKEDVTNNCVLSVDCEDKFARTKRLAKEKAEDAATAAKRSKSLLEQVMEMLGVD